MKAPSVTLRVKGDSRADCVTLSDPYVPHRTWNSPFFDALGFFVAHLFLYPIFLGFWATYLLLFGDAFARTVTIGCVFLYGASMFDRAQYSGERTWLHFRQPWLRCHPYFPIVSEYVVHFCWNQYNEPFLPFATGDENV